MPDIKHVDFWYKCRSCGCLWFLRDEHIKTREWQELRANHFSKRLISTHQCKAANYLELGEKIGISDLSSVEREFNLPGKEQ